MELVSRLGLFQMSKTMRNNHYSTTHWVLMNQDVAPPIEGGDDKSQLPYELEEWYKLITFEIQDVLTRLRNCQKSSRLLKHEAHQLMVALQTFAVVSPDKGGSLSMDFPYAIETKPDGELPSLAHRERLELSKVNLTFLIERIKPYLEYLNLTITVDDKEIRFVKWPRDYLVHFHELKPSQVIDKALEEELYRTNGYSMTQVAMHILCQCHLMLFQSPNLLVVHESQGDWSRKGCDTPNVEILDKSLEDFDADYKRIYVQSIIGFMAQVMKTHDWRHLDWLRDDDGEDELAAIRLADGVLV